MVLKFSQNGIYSMKGLREKFIDSAMMKSSIIDVVEGSECVPGKCPPPPSMWH